MVQQRRGDEEAPLVARMPWPVIPPAFIQYAEILAEKVRAQRGNFGASVAQEERLDSDVKKVLDQAMRSPKEGLGGATIELINKDPNYKRSLMYATKILASHLYPISALIYRDFENVTCLDYNHWIAKKGTETIEYKTNDGVPFANSNECEEFFRRLLALRGVTGTHEMTLESPVAEAQIGSVVRLLVLINPVLSGTSGVSAAIRIPPRFKVKGLGTYVSGGVMPQGVADFLAACVKARINLLIAGGTGTGKTTLLRILCGLIPEDELVVVIEDGAELHLDKNRGDGEPWHRLTVALTVLDKIPGNPDSGLTMFELVRNSLRLRPDRLILGESRGEEMAAICKAMMTGHEGSMTTIHANSDTEAVEQATLYTMESSTFSANQALAKMTVQRGIHMVVHLGIVNGRRRLTGISAIEEGGGIVPIYKLNLETEAILRITDTVNNLHRDKRALREALGTEEIPPAI